MGKVKTDPLVLDPGALRHNIVIQQQTMTPDAQTGAPSQTWTTVLSTQAAIRTTSTREAYQAQQFVEQVTHVITIRWPGSAIVINGGMRVVFGGRNFNVQTVENVLERNRVLNLVCLEVDGGQ